MAQVNLAPGEYGSIIIQSPGTRVADPSSPKTLAATGANEAAYVSAVWATNPDVGVWSVSLYVYDESNLIPIKRNVRLAPRGKTGNSINLLDGSPLYLPESHTLYVGLDEYVGPSGTGTGVPCLCSWAKILPPA